VSWVIYVPSNTATSVSLAGHNVNCRNTDASLSGRLRLRIRRNVRHALFLFLLCTHYHRRHFRASETQAVWKDTRPVSKTKRTTAIKVSLNQAVVSMPSTDEQYLASRSSERNSCNSMDWRRCDPQNGLAINHDLESGMEKSAQ
jgi:hypothetical protein